jgi:hypothetical protein
LLSERSPEPNRPTRTRALPLTGLIRSVIFRSQARRYQEEECRGLAMGMETPRSRIPSNHPSEPCIDPLYLFACGLSWRKHSNNTAGWELVRCLRSSGQTSGIAAALLAQAENIRPVQAPARAIGAPPKAPLRREAGLPKSARWWL